MVKRDSHHHQKLCNASLPGSDDSNLKWNINKNISDIKNSDFIINLLRDRIYSSEQCVIEKKIIDSLDNQQMSPVATYSNTYEGSRYINERA